MNKHKSAKVTLRQNSLRWLGVMMFSAACTLSAQPVDNATADPQATTNVETAAEPVNGPVAPVRHDRFSFQTLAPEGSLVLRGVQNTAQMTFTVRSDEVVTQAILNMDYTISPALLPLLSHIKVYLNDELMGIAPVEQGEPGKKNTVNLPLDARYISDFNRLNLELVGHYKDVCEDPTHSSIWIDISKSSNVEVTFQGLDVRNDLSLFPEPFYDHRDFRPLTLPLMFSEPPTLDGQRAAAMLASWFGVQTQWRGMNFPVIYNQLPDRNGVVLATNDKRPAFLADYPSVDRPTVEMISHPENPYIKLLLILGRDDSDLLAAVEGIARGEQLLRGSSSTIDGSKQLEPRKPYDAPNWVRTDRPVRLSELITYDEQLSVSGGRVPPIDLDLRLPPDLFLLRSKGVTLDLRYRYTPPAFIDDSRLNVSLNNRFLQSFPLKPYESKTLEVLHIPLIQGLTSTDDEVLIPAFELGGNNKLRFHFDFVSNIGASTTDVCRTMTPVQHEAVIDGDSTIDFSGYQHYLAMPSLKAFADSGFPFSRLADLSETVILMPANPSADQLTLLFNVLGQIGANIGYPALRVELANQFEQQRHADKDILVFSDLPAAFTTDTNYQVLIDGVKSQLNQPHSNKLFIRTLDFDKPNQEAVPQSHADISSEGAIGVITGFQSPYNKQRSVVALMSSGDRGYQLLDEAWRDSGKRSAIAGSVAVVRQSGVSSLRVGDTYYLGYLPWWDKMWYHLSFHPVLLAILAVFSVILVAIMLWRGLRLISRRRLSEQDDE